MKESSDSPIKNNCLSSDLLKFKGLYNIHDGINGQFKENKNIDKNSTQYNQLSETHLQKNLSSSLIQFMENQDKKHLSTNFNHQNVKKFLEEKEKAMEKIIFEDESLDENDKTDNEEKEDRNKSNIKDKNESFNFNKENDENKNNNKKENNNILIFHGTFGEDKVNEILNRDQHHQHHRHSHHHHHHHHHHQDDHKLESQNGNENKSNFAFEY
jgi:hypothetical protein